MKPAKIRRSREELQKEAEANFRYYESEQNPFAPTDQPEWHLRSKPKLPCHVPNCTSPECDRFHPGDEE